VSISSRLRSLWPRKKVAPRRNAGAAFAPSSTPTVAERRNEKARHHLPRFVTSAADHVDRDRLDARSRERVKLRNSFTPTQPVVDPQMFAGRRESLESLISAVEDQKSHVVLFGDRGVGKTSLLRMLSRAAKDANYIVVYYSCGATSDFTETFRAVAADIPLLYHSSISPISMNTEVGRSLLDLLGPGKLTPRLIGDAAAKIVGTRVLVVLDEFDRTESPEFRRDVAELIKTLSDVSARLHLVIGGVAADLNDLMEHIPSIRRNVAAVRIGPMPDDEVRALVDNGSRLSGVKFEPGAIDLIVSAARGSPYLTSLLSHVAGMLALDAGRLTVALDDVAQALDDVIDDFRSRIPRQLALQLDEAAQGLEFSRTAAGDAPEDKSTGAAKRRRDLPIASVHARILENLEKQGAFEGVQPAAYALMLDNVTPYLELKSARERILVSAA
jgi:Cdc6-like AAA superfamily ATPase